MVSKASWDELTDGQKEAFADLCRSFVELDGTEDAEEYYGNRGKLIGDSLEGGE